MANQFTNDMISSAGDLSCGYHFKVEFNEISFGFQNVDGIELTRSYDSLQEGGVNDHKVLVGRPMDSLPTLTFSRGYIIRASSVVTGAAKAAAARITNNAARKAALIALNTLDPQEILEYGPALGFITVYSTTRKNKVIARFSFFALGISSWSLEGLNAASGELLVEKFSVLHNGITRIPLIKPALASGAYYLGLKDNVKDNIDDTKSFLDGPGEPLDFSDIEKSKKEFEAARMAELHKSAKTRQEAFEEMADTLKKEEEAFKKARDTALSENIKKLRDEYKRMYDALEGSEENPIGIKKQFLITLEETKKAAKEKKKEISKNLAQMLEKSERKYIFERNRLNESLNETLNAQKKVLQQVQKHSRELANSTRAASQLAQEAMDRLALDMVNFRERQKEKLNAYQEQAKEAEISKFAAIQTMELARAMAKSSKEAAKEFQAQQWKEIKKQYQEELDEIRENFEKERNQGLQKTEKAVEERLIREEEHRDEVGRMEQSKKEFAEARDRENKKRVAKTQQEYELRMRETEEVRDEAMSESAINNEEENKANLKEVEEAKQEFVEARNEATKERVTQTQEEYELRFQEIEAAKKEFEEQRKKAKEAMKEMEADAMEAAAEAENRADEIQGML